MKTLEFNQYINRITGSTYIQAWFVGEPVTQKSAVDCIIESYPLPEGISREMVEEWVADEVTAYNDSCDPDYPEQYLPSA